MEGEQPQLGDLLAMAINHLLTGMILQVVDGKNPGKNSLTMLRLVVKIPIIFPGVLFPSQARWLLMGFMNHQQYNSYIIGYPQVTIPCIKRFQESNYYQTTKEKPFVDLSWWLNPPEPTWEKKYAPKKIAQEKYCPSNSLCPSWDGVLWPFDRLSDLQK